VAKASAPEADKGSMTPARALSWVLSLWYITSGTGSLVGNAAATYDARSAKGGGCCKGGCNSSLTFSEVLSVGPSSATDRQHSVLARQMGEEANLKLKKANASG